MSSNRTPSKMSVTACLATSLDGKISPPSDGPYIRMSTDEDIAHLKRLRDDAEAIVFGASTFRAYAKPRYGLDNPKKLVHCILTRSLDLPKDSPLFEDGDIPTLIFTPTQAPDALCAQYPSHLEWHTLDAEQPAAHILKTLEEKGIQKVQVEGGGEVLPMFLNEKLLQSIHLTVCPLFIGHKPGIPGLISQPLDVCVKTKILNMKPLGDELYLHYECLYN